MSYLDFKGNNNFYLVFLRCCGESFSKIYFYFFGSHHYLESLGLLAKRAVYKGFKPVNLRLYFWGFFGDGENIKQTMHGL